MNSDEIITGIKDVLRQIKQEEKNAADRSNYSRSEYTDGQVSGYHYSAQYLEKFLAYVEKTQKPVAKKQTKRPRS